MLKKRLVGVVTVRRGQAVQSFSYRRYLPLGRPEVVVENLDRWGVDEILVQVTDRTLAGEGPDLALLRRLGSLGLSTPLIYAGGVYGEREAVELVRSGADRIVVDALLRDAPARVEAMARELGSQALIAHMPVRVEGDTLLWYDYRTRSDTAISRALLDALHLDWASEVMLTDWAHEGKALAFDESIPALFPLASKPLVLFGGLSCVEQMQRMLARENVAAVGVGNFLHYREHAVQHLKRGLEGVSMRAARFSEGLIR